MFVLFLHCAYCIYSDDCTLCNVCVNLQMHCVNAMLLFMCVFSSGVDLVGQLAFALERQASK